MKKILLFLGSFLLVIGIYIGISFAITGGKSIEQTIDYTVDQSVYHKKTEPTLSEISTTKAENETASPTISETKPVPTETQSNIDASKKLIDSFNPICQYPELPTGCEITSLTMVLNYYGYAVDKGQLSDNYLDKGEVGTVDFRKSFEGDPRDSNSYGCYAPVIVNTANKYLAENGSEMRAVDITNTNFEELFEYTDVGIPVVLWCTYELAHGHFSVTWNVDGKDLTWFTPEHCMVLLGQKGNKVIVADPASGEIKSYKKSLLEKRYEELFRQAIIIQ